MPIDDELTPDGNLVVDLDEEVYWVLAGELLAQSRERGELLAISHFVTCPHSRQHRRG